MLCCCVWSFVYNRCLPVHVHVCPLLFLEVTSSILEMASTVDGLPRDRSYRISSLDDTC